MILRYKLMLIVGIILFIFSAWGIYHKLAYGDISFKQFYLNEEDIDILVGQCIFDSYKTFHNNFFWHENTCFLQGIYNQNHISLQEQNQTNKLLAYNYCKGESTQNLPLEVPIDKVGNITIMGFNGTYVNPFDLCVSKVLNDTK